MNKIYEDITIVTVLYNSKKSAQSFFSNLVNFSIIVVDNGRNEKVLEKIKDYKNIKIISKNKEFFIKSINIFKFFYFNQQRPLSYIYTYLVFNL